MMGKGSANEMSQVGGDSSNRRCPGSRAMVKAPCTMRAVDSDSSDEDFAEESLSPLPISWLSLSPVYPSELLGLCSLPGCRFKDIRRNLQKDVEELKNYEIQDVFVLCTRGELSKYRVPNLIDTYHQHGICVHHYPIPDGDAPDIAMCCSILEELRSCLESNQKTIIHCYGGLGRSCVIAACLLLQLSDAVTPQQVIDHLRSLRGPGAIQTIKERGADIYKVYKMVVSEERGLPKDHLLVSSEPFWKQYNFLHDYRENLAAHVATKDAVSRSVSR